MHGSAYVDIFATKGIEYLFVIGFLCALLVFWRVLSRLGAGAATAGTAARAGWFRFADGLFYHQGHTWARPESRDTARVGVDDFAQMLLGAPDAVELPRVGDTVAQGEGGMKLRVAGKNIDLLSPIGGQVVAINDEVLATPRLLNDDPYGEGWLFEVRAPKLKSNLKNLLSGGLARSWMERAGAALRGRIATVSGGELGVVLQDGGLPVAGIARELSPEGWEDVAKDFLLTR